MNNYSLTYGLNKTGLPLVSVKLYEHDLCFLLDTGSNQNIIDKRVYSAFEDKICILAGNTSVCGLHGDSDGIAVELSFTFEEDAFTEPFSCVGEIAGFDSIRNETGIQIHGILGNNFFLKHNWIIDFDKMTLTH